METIQTINTQQATERLRGMGMKISPDTIRRGIQQGVFPFGDCVVTDRGAHCYIYVRLLDEWVKERACRAKEESAIS